MIVKPDTTPRPSSRGCVNKIRYSSRAEALGGIRRAKSTGATGKSGAGRLHAYECKFCGHWHVGHNGRVGAR